MRLLTFAAPSITMSAAAGERVLYATRCTDIPVATALRAANRAAHLKWIAGDVEQYRFAGPVREEQKGAPSGSLLIMDTDASVTKEDVAAKLEGDPYADAGLFESVETRRWVCGMRSDPPLPDPLFSVWCVDKEGQKPLRKETRPAHLEWWRNAGRKGWIGPFPADDGDGAVGSLILCEGASMEEVKEWAATDPYNEAGLFEEVHVNHVTKIVEDGKMLVDLSPQQT